MGSSSSSGYQVPVEQPAKNPRQVAGHLYLEEFYLAEEDAGY